MQHARLQNPRCGSYVRYLNAREYLFERLQKHGRADYRVRALVRCTAIAQRQYHRQLNNNPAKQYVTQSEQQPCLS